MNELKKLSDSLQAKLDAEKTMSIKDICSLSELPIIRNILIKKGITRKDWHDFGDFGDFKKLMWFTGLNLVEVDEDIYYSFLECLPPQQMGKGTRANFPITVSFTSYYLAGERVNSKGYNTFAKTKDNKYYYMGLYNPI